MERRLVADVTVGTCLSGGLDSSSIVSVMSGLLAAGAPDASSMGDRLKTFSAVFDGDPIDEQRYIAPVLEATGAESHFVRPQSGEMFDDLPLVVWHQDEPMVSSGPYAQYRVMQLAKGKAKVLLDGQGGDELLAGYVPYQYVYLRELLDSRAGSGWRRTRQLAARDVLSPLVRQQALRPPEGGRPPGALQREAAGLRPRRRGDRPLTAGCKTTLKSTPAPGPDRATAFRRCLRYEDRNSMAHSIESRPPFLDQELVELVLALPSDAIVRDGWSRWILRESLAGVLPELVRTRRKKIGFTTPEIRWLRAAASRRAGNPPLPGLLLAAILGCARPSRGHFGRAATASSRSRPSSGGS